MQRNWDPCALLQGMKQVAIMENGMVVPQKIKSRITYGPASPFLGIYPEELKPGT